MNDKNIKILIRFLLFLSVLGCVCLYGITHTYALETKTVYSGNNNGTLSSANTYRYGYMAGGVQNVGTASINTTVNGQSIAFMFYVYETVSLNKIYTMEINFMDSDLLKSFNTSFVHSYTCQTDVCNLNSIVSVVKNNNTGNSNKLTIQFTPTSPGTYFYTNLSNSASVQNLTGINTFGIKSILLGSVNQNEDIMNNANQNATNIINNNNSNTQEIINNQNQNTQDMIDSQNVCQRIDKNNIEITSHYLDSQGREIAYNDWGITNYIKIDTNTKIKVLQTHTVNGNGTVTSCFYNVNKTLISCQYQGIYSIGDFIAIPNNAEYVRFNIRSSTNKPQLEICKNGNQALSDDLQNLNDSLTDSSSVDMSTLGDVAGWLPAGPIDSIINLPLTFMNNLYTALSGTCSPLHIPIPFLDNKFIDIPCISTIYQQINGFTTFWNWVGGICSVLILYKYLIALYKYYDDLTTLKANFISDFGGAP